MNYLERIHVQGFRRLHDVDLPLKPLNVMIGANGCGKTSLLGCLFAVVRFGAGNLKRRGSAKCRGSARTLRSTGRSR